MYAMELLEGKDYPHQMGTKEFNNLGGKTVRLSNTAMLLMIITIGGKPQSALKGPGLQTGGLVGSLHY